MSLFSTLNTGVSGLKSSSLATATTGHNIANANNDYYTRQRVVTSPSMALHNIPGDVGTGVRVTSIERIHDEFVYSRLKDSSNSLSYDTFTKQSLEEVAKYFPDIQNSGLEVDIQNYYAAWNDFSSNANDASQKIALVESGSTLSTNLAQSRDSVRALQDSINTQLKTNVDEMNTIGEQIVNLNISINRVESTNQNNANDLRDQRDQLELTLSKLVDISVFKGDISSKNNINANLTDQGTGYHMNISGNSFVDGMTFHPIVITNSANSSNYYSIYSESQDGSRVEITDKLTGGKVGAMLDLRGRHLDPAANSGFPSDGILQGYVDNLDKFAKTFIEQTNSIYAKSAQDSMSSAPNIDLKDNTNLTSYSRSIQNGSFNVIVYDMQGNEVAKKAININSLTNINDGTADSIVGQFNANTDDNANNNSLDDVDDYFTASYSYSDSSKSGILSFQPKDTLSGYKIAIDDNGTSFAGVIGMSQFFSGNNASNMDVQTKFKEDPSKVNAYGAPIEGNNDVANNMVQMQYDNFDFYSNNYSTPTSESIEGFYRSVTTQIAVDGESAGRRHETSTALFNTINDEFQSISGVNVDEELTNLMKFQAAYGANAKVITTIDQMLNILLGIKQ